VLYVDNKAGYGWNGKLAPTELLLPAANNQTLNLNYIKTETLLNLKPVFL